MNIEETVKELTEIKELVEEDLKYKDYNVTAVLDQIDLESLVIVLNELDKKDKIKNKIKKYNNLRIVAETKEINDMFVNYIDCLEELLEE